MGQKINPNILRLGKVKEWKSKYIEKKPTESSAMMFRDLEIRKFIFQLFAKHELQIYDCKVTFSESSLEIYISFYSSAKISMANTIKKMIPLKNKKTLSNYFLKKINKIKKVTLKKHFYTAKTSHKIFSTPLKREKLQNQFFFHKKTHRLGSIEHFKSYNEGKKYKTLNKQDLNLFIAKVLKSLSLFMNKKQDIFLNLKQLNNETSFLQEISSKNKQNLGKNFIKLRKFQQNEFFTKGLNILYNFIQNKLSPIFLAKFIAFYLDKLKRPIFFLRFLQIALKTLANKNLHKLERIQIKIKGRFNGASRSSYKLINIKKSIPALNLNSNLNYGESTAYTSNGTFGIKVWTLQKKNIMFNGPKKTKFKKTRKGKLGKLEFKTNKLTFGTIGLKAAESGILNSRQIEAARQSLARKAKRKAKIWIKIYPDLSITAKSTGIRMGKGKGQFSYWGARVRGGTVLFEVCGVNSRILMNALKMAGAKLPIKTKIFQ